MGKKKPKKATKPKSLIERGSREVQRKMRFKHNQMIADGTLCAAEQPTKETP